MEDYRTITFSAEEDLESTVIKGKLYRIRDEVLKESGLSLEELTHLDKLKDLFLVKIRITPDDGVNSHKLLTYAVARINQLFYDLPLDENN